MLLVIRFKLAQIIVIVSLESSLFAASKLINDHLTGYACLPNHPARGLPWLFSNLITISNVLIFFSMVFMELKQSFIHTVKGSDKGITGRLRVMSPCDSFSAR